MYCRVECPKTTTLFGAKQSPLVKPVVKRRKQNSKDVFFFKLNFSPLKMQKSSIKMYILLLESHLTVSRDLEALTLLVTIHKVLVGGCICYLLQQNCNLPTDRVPINFFQVFRCYTFSRNDRQIALSASICAQKQNKNLGYLSLCKQLQKFIAGFLRFTIIQQFLYDYFDKIQRNEKVNLKVI